MKDRTRKDAILEQQLGGDRARDFKNKTGAYRHQPNGPVVLNTTGGQESIPVGNPIVTTCPDIKWVPNDHGGFGAAIQGPTPLAQADEADVFGPPTRENKFWVLQALGFLPEGGNNWYHSDLGNTGLPGRYYTFDLDKDDLKTIIENVYRMAWDESREHCRNQFKTFLGL